MNAAGYVLTGMRRIRSRAHAPMILAPYEFGVKASVATTLKHSKGGQFIVHARTLPGNP
jgi:hypothetical protein